MKIKFTIVLIFILLKFLNIQAQVTSIADQGFEEELIYQNIDSDGVVNGQVLTSDISSLTSLAFTGFYIVYNIEGIEDFNALQSLDITETRLDGDNGLGVFTELDLSNNTELESLTLIGDDDNILNFITRIDLSNNLLLDNIDVPSNWLLKELDLKTGSTDVSNLNINIDIVPNDSGGGPDDESDAVCIKVTDATAANANQGVYATWFISAVNNPYYFSETCTLNTQRFDDEDFVIYPNPVSNSLFIKHQIIDIDKLTIFDQQGRIVLQKESLLDNSLDVSALQKGIYILKLQTKNGSIHKRFLKE